MLNKKVKLPSSTNEYLKPGPLRKRKVQGSANTETPVLPKGELNAIK